MDNFDYERLANEIARAMSGSGAPAGTRSFNVGSVSDFIQRLQQYSNEIKKQTSPMGKITSVLLRHNQELANVSKNINDEYKKQLSDTIKNGTREERKILQENKSYADKQIAIAGTINSLTAFKKTATEVGTAFGNIISSAGNFLQGNGNEIGAVGNVLGTFANQIPIVGGAFSSIVGIFVRELEKTVEQFRNSSKAGALFVDGMTGLRNSANQAGLTIQQFGSVISSNSRTLAESGLSVGEAARALGNVGKVIRTSGIQTQLLNLGYSFEEQAALTADVLAIMRRANSAYMQDPNAVARGVSDYATNLRTIAAITGEDAKRKMEEAKASSSQIAVRLKLQELEKRSPGITAAYEAAIATRSEAEKRAINQLFTLGTVTDVTSNVLMASNQGIKNGIEGFVGLLESGNVNVKDYQILQGRSNDQMRNNLEGLRAIGIAGIAGVTGIVGDASRQGAEKLRETDAITEKSVLSAQQAVDGQKNTADALTNATNSTIQAVQNFRVQFENEILAYLPQFSSALQSIIATTQSFVNSMGGIVQLMKEVAGGLVGALVGGLLGVIGGAILGFLAGGPPGALLGMAIGGKLGASAGFLIGAGTTATFSPPARAAGGPVNPSSTYLVGERGPELFRPQSSGEIISNSQMSSYTKSNNDLGDLKNLLQEQIMLGKLQMDQYNDMLNYMREQRDLQQSILYASS